MVTVGSPFIKMYALAIVHILLVELSFPLLGYEVLVNEVIYIFWYEGLNLWPHTWQAGTSATELNPQPFKVI